MDLNKTIEELRRDKANLERAITFLEQLQDPAVAMPVRRRRGRKSTLPEERQEVSVQTMQGIGPHAVANPETDDTTLATNTQ
jgi:hypothetical protein